MQFLTFSMHLPIYYVHDDTSKWPTSFRTYTPYNPQYQIIWPLNAKYIVEHSHENADNLFVWLFVLHIFILYLLYFFFQMQYISFHFTTTRPTQSHSKSTKKLYLQMTKWINWRRLKQCVNTRDLFELFELFQCYYYMHYEFSFQFTWCYIFFLNLKQKQLNSHVLMYIV